MQTTDDSQQQTINRIRQALSRTDNNFALFFALVNQAETRQLITTQLIQVLNRPVVAITANPVEINNTTLDAWLLPQLNAAPKESIIFLYNLNTAFPTEKKALRHYLQQLNWRRASLAAMQRPLVIWLPAYAIEQLAEYAPDFYDWYSNVYEFPTSTTDKASLKADFQTEFNSMEIHPAQRMRKQDKQQWLHTLSILLAEHSDRNQYRAKLLTDLGHLHKALGNLDNAQENYNTALSISQEIGNKAGKGATLNNISQIYKARGDYETALDFLQQSLAITQEIGDKAGEGATLFNMGHIHAQNKAMDKAVGAWVRAYQLAKPMQLTQVLDALANLAPQLGLPEGLQGWEALAKQQEAE